GPEVELPEHLREALRDREREQSAHVASWLERRVAEERGDLAPRGPSKCHERSDPAAHVRDEHRVYAADGQADEGGEERGNRPDDERRYDEGTEAPPRLEQRRQDCGERSDEDGRRDDSQCVRERSV